MSPKNTNEVLIQQSSTPHTTHTDDATTSRNRTEAAGGSWVTSTWDEFERLNQKIWDDLSTNIHQKIKLSRRNSSGNESHFGQGFNFPLAPSYFPRQNSIPPKQQVNVDNQEEKFEIIFNTVDYKRKILRSVHWDTF